MACTSCKGFNIVIENGFDNPSLLLTEGVNSTALQNQLKPMFSAALAEMTSVSYSHFAKVKNINVDKALAEKLKPIVEKYIKKIVEKDYLANLITKSVDKSNVTLKDVELKKENLQQIKQELIKAKIEIDKKSNEVASVLKYVTFLFSVLAPESAANLAQIGIAKNLVKPSKPTSRMTKTPRGVKITKKAGVDLIRDPVTGEMRPPRPEDFEVPVEDGEDRRQLEEATEDYILAAPIRGMTSKQREEFNKLQREGVKYFNDFMGVIDPTGIFDGMNVVLYAQDYAMTTDQKKKDEALLYGLFSLIGAVVPYAGDFVVKPFKYGFKVGKKTPAQAIKDLIEFVQKYAPKLLEGLEKLISKAPKKVKEFYNRLLSLIKDPNKIQKIAKVGTKGVGYANRAAAEATELFVRRWSTLTSKQVGTQVAIYSALYVEQVRELFEAALTLPVEVLTKMVSLANDSKSLDEIIEQINQTKLLDNHQIVKNILKKLYRAAEKKSREQKTKADLGKSADEPLQENNKAIKIRILENKAVVLNENKAIKSLVTNFADTIKRYKTLKVGPRALEIEKLLKGKTWKDITQYTRAADYSTFISRLRNAGIVTYDQASRELDHLITQLKAARDTIDVRQIEIDKATQNGVIADRAKSFNKASSEYNAIKDALDKPVDSTELFAKTKRELRIDLLKAEEARELAGNNLRRAQEELRALENLQQNRRAIDAEVASLEARKKQLLSGGKATDDAAKTATKTTDDAAEEVAKNAKKGPFWKRAVKGAGKKVLIGYGIYAGTNIVCRALAEPVVSFKLLQSLLRSDFLKWMEGLAVAVAIGAYDTIKTVFGVSAATAAKTYREKFGLVGSIVFYTTSGFFGCAEGGTERLSISFAAGLAKANLPQTMNEITIRMAADAGIPESELDGALYTLTEKPDVLSWQFLGRAGLSLLPGSRDYGSIANSLIEKTDVADYALRVTTGTIGILASPDDVLDLDDETKEKALNFIQNAFEQKTFLPSEAIRQIIITKKYLEKNGLRDKTLQSQFIKCMYREYALQIAKSTKEEIKAAFDTLGISKEGIKDPNKVINKIIGTGLETFEEIEKKYNEADKEIQKGLEKYGFKNPIRTYLEAAKNYVREGKNASPTELKNFNLTYEDTKKYLEGELKHYEEKYKADTPEKVTYKDNNIAYYNAMIEKLKVLHNKIVTTKEIKKEEEIEENKPIYSCEEISTKYKTLWEKTTRVFNISKGIDFKPGDEVQRISDGEYYEVDFVNTKKRTMNLRDRETNKKLKNQKFSNYLISDKKTEEEK